MPKKSKRVNKKTGTNKRRGTNKVKNGTRSTGTRSTGTRSIKKQPPVIMIGCSKNKHMKTSCPNCGEKCHCGPDCRCPHNCPGNCYLNRRIKKHKGGAYSGYSTNSGGCGSVGCPISPLSWTKMGKFGGGCSSCGQNGGSCGSCGQMGGESALAPAQVPGPFTGQPWGPVPNEWPGVDGISGGRNYLSPVNVVQNPQQQMSMADSGYIGKPNSMVGGYKKGGYKKGGGLFPQDLVNLGSGAMFNFKSAYNSMNGYNAPVDPSPYKGQLTGNNRIMI
jgi:hypothetical protein